MGSVTGSWGPQNLATYAMVDFFDYPVPVSGEYSISLSTTGLQSSGSPDLLVLNKNGTNVAPGSSTDPPNRSYTGNFTAGDIIGAQVFVLAARTNVTASWTITSDVLDPGDPGDPVEPEGVIEVEEIDMIYFGGDEAEALYKGTLLVWEALSGPQDDAKLWMKFDNQANFLENLGTATTSVSVIGGVTHEGDHARFGSGRLRFTPSSNWYSGFTFSYWTRDTAANSGWQTIMHRAVPSGTLTNEAYIVHNTSSTTTAIVSGLKFGSTHKESPTNYALPVGTDWFHTTVVWTRTSTTGFNVTFYINGVQRGSYNHTGYSSSASQFGSEQVWVGGNRTANEWSGRMDDLTMWDRPLSAAEVTEVYNQGRSWVPNITTLSVPNFPINEFAYFSFSDDFSADSWSATGVPAGMSMSTVGVLSGTPTTVSSGTITVTATRTSTGHSATKSFSWAITDIPPLTVRTINANGSKVSHSGWAKPNLTWSIVTGSGGTFNKDGTLVMFRGRGKVRFTATLNTARSARIVSNLKGVLVTSVSASSSHNLVSAVWVFEEEERIHVEIDSYSGNVVDRLSLASEP